MKHNFNLNQIILLCENGEVTTDDGTKFQITEVKSETVAPDYSHLVGKWVRCSDSFDQDHFTIGKWYKCISNPAKPRAFLDNDMRENGFNYGDENKNPKYFDLSNPLDYNPTELIGKYYQGFEITEIEQWVDGEMIFRTKADSGKHWIKCYAINTSEVTDTPPTKSLKYDDVVGEVKPLYYCLNEGLIRKDLRFQKGFHYKTVATERDAKKLRATAQLLVVMHAANGDWVWDEEQKCYGIYYSLTHKNHPIIEYELTLPQIYFRTRELALKALADNKQLFNEYFGIDE